MFGRLGKPLWRALPALAFAIVCAGAGLGGSGCASRGESSDPDAAKVREEVKRPLEPERVEPPLLDEKTREKIREIRTYVERVTGREARNARRRRKAVKRFMRIAGGVIEPHACMSEAGVNERFIFQYAELQKDPRADYAAIILGDSTAHINAYTNQLIPWYNPATTKSAALAGNRLCHMLITLRASVKTPGESIRLALTSTLGGNDLLARLETERIVAHARDYLAALRARFPNARLVGVGIHPVHANQKYANARRDEINRAVRQVWLSIPDTCFVDPAPAFGVGPGEGAPETLLYDEIHYNALAARRIKDLITSSCSVSF